MPGLWLVWDAIIAVNPNSFEFIDFICAALVLSLSDTIFEKDEAQNILYELKNFTSGFNIDIMKLVDLARSIKTRLTGKLMDPSPMIDDVGGAWGGGDSGSENDDGGDGGDDGEEEGGDDEKGKESKQESEPKEEEVQNAPGPITSTEEVVPSPYKTSTIEPLLTL